MDSNLHINVAEIPPEVGESFGRVTLAGFKNSSPSPETARSWRLRWPPTRLAKKGSAQNDEDSDGHVLNHRRAYA